MVSNHSAPSPAPEGARRPPVAVRPRRILDTPRFLVGTMRRHGDVVCLDPKRNRYLITRPDDLKHVLQDNHLNYRHLIPARPLMGHESLTMSSGDAWRQRRRLMQPLFHPQRLSRLAPRMSAAVTGMLERWRGAAASGEPLDAAQEMVRLSLEALIATFFGDDADQALTRAANDAFEYFDARLRRRGFALPRFLPTPLNRRLKHALGTMQGLISRIIAERRRRPEDRGDLLSMLMLAEDPQSGESLNDRQLLDELMMLLVMGHMNTAMALTWTWYALSKHPHVERRLHRELATVLDGRSPTVEDLPRLTYARRVIEEVLRLYPPSWLFSRGARDRDVIGGYEIPAGSKIQISPYVTHRRPDLWPNPEGFDPERFHPERASGRHRYAYLPFGGGPRSCIASSFATMEISLVVATVAEIYRLDLLPEQPIAMQAAITLQPRDGLRMTLYERNGGP